MRIYFVILLGFLMSCASTKKSKDKNASEPNQNERSESKIDLTKAKSSEVMEIQTIVRSNSGTIEGAAKGNYVINTVNDLRVFSELSDISKLNAVDLTKETIIAVVAKEFTSGGYDIEIKALKVIRDSIVCMYKISEPGPTDMVTTALTQPCHFIKIKKTTRRIIFKKL